MIKRFKHIIAAVCFVGATPIAFADDISGSRDHPDIPRIAGSSIDGYKFSQYDAVDFVTAFEDRELEMETPEGEYARIVYVAPQGTSPLFVMRNYQKAASDLGTRTDVYACTKGECPTNLGTKFVWNQDKRLETGDPDISRTMSFTHMHQDQVYWYGTVVTADSRFHISSYAVTATGKSEVPANTTLIVLDVLKEVDFEASLETVTPVEIVDSIDREGRIALYGIHFDVDSATLKSDSSTELRAVASALANKSDLKLYVVGHTDDQGEYDYNLGLSQQRASSVVEYLTGELGVDPTRLKAIGVGPVSPVASNSTDEGQAKNRRVELVEF